MAAWPCVSRWIADNFDAALLRRHSRHILMAYWLLWIDAADILPPLLIDSDSESTYDDTTNAIHQYEADSEDNGSGIYNDDGRKDWTRLHAYRLKSLVSALQSQQEQSV